MKRDSAGNLILATYHPKSSPTWHWSLSLIRSEHAIAWGWRFFLVGQPGYQRHHLLRLPFGWTLMLSTQIYHKNDPWRRTQ